MKRVWILCVFPVILAGISCTQRKAAAPNDGQIAQKTEYMDFYEKLKQDRRSSASISTSKPVAEPTRTSRSVKDFRLVKYAPTLAIGQATDLHLELDELPLTSIRPEGWLRQYLKDQKDGLTGQIKVAGFPFKTTMWVGDKIESNLKTGDWAAYEQTAFYLDGMIRVALLLRDETLLNRAIRQIEYVLAHPDENGVLGPRHVHARWPRANFFRFMRAWYNSTGDQHIVDALVRHFKADTELVDKEEFGRSSVMIETLTWLYQLTGDRRFVDHAVRMKEYFDKTSQGHACTTQTLLSDRQPHVHGAMFAEMVHLPAMLYMTTGNARWLNASQNGYEKVTREHMLPDGIFSSEEGTNGRGPRNLHETCAIADYTYNTGYMLMITGDPHWADRIERAALNAGTSVVTNRFRAFQYFSGPNLPLSDRWSSHADAPHERDDKLTHFTRERTRYRPGFSVPCCTGSVHRIMPAYASRLWLSDRKGGLAAALYAPCSIAAKVGTDQTPIRIVVKTDFPFSDTIKFEIHTDKPVRFPLHLRIPSWAKNPSISINGTIQTLVTQPGTFVTLTRTFQPDDRITLTLPMELKMTQWPESGVAVERGPLVYTLKIEEDRKSVDYVPWETQVNGPNPDFPQWDIYPASSWNYALATDTEHLQQDARITQKRICTRPWESGQAPIEIRLPVRKIPGWDYLRLPPDKVRIWPHKKHEKRPDIYTFTPHLPQHVDCTSPIEHAAFVPYGSTCIRMTILPQCPHE